MGLAMILMPTREILGVITLSRILLTTSKFGVSQLLSLDMRAIVEKFVPFGSYGTDGK
jgi:hypothetical protein